MTLGYTTKHILSSIKSMISLKICIHFVQRMHTAHNKEHSSEFDWVDLISSMIIFSDTERKCVCLLQSMHFRDLFWIFLSESTLIQVAITIFYDFKKKKIRSAYSRCLGCLSLWFLSHYLLHPQPTEIHLKENLS